MPYTDEPLDPVEQPIPPQTAAAVIADLDRELREIEEEARRDKGFPKTVTGRFPADSIDAALALAFEGSKPLTLLDKLAALDKGLAQLNVYGQDSKRIARQRRIAAGTKGTELDPERTKRKAKGDVSGPRDAGGLTPDERQLLREMIQRWEAEQEWHTVGVAILLEQQDCEACWQRSTISEGLYLVQHARPSVMRAGQSRNLRRLQALTTQQLDDPLLLAGVPKHTVVRKVAVQCCAHCSSDFGFASAKAPLKFEDYLP